MSLCSGIGGLELGIQIVWPSHRTIVYVENDPSAQIILNARMAAGDLDVAPLWDDLRTFDGRPWRGVVDCVSAGYPCQPFSLAGKRRGRDDARNVWTHVARIIGECGPAVVVLENVAGHLTLGFDAVAADLVGLGYRVAAGLFTAAEVGTPHRRKRLFALGVRGYGGRIMDDAMCLRGKYDARGEVSTGRSSPLMADGTMGNPHQSRLEGLAGADGTDELPPWPPGPAERDRWDAILSRWPDLAPALANAENGHARMSRRGQSTRRSTKGDAPESPLRGVADGIPAGVDRCLSRTDRLRLLGNAVVPAQAAHAITILSQMCQCGETRLFYVGCEDRQ
jgi:DNA (cytosine-5)-methyltransferase 1